MLDAANKMFTETRGASVVHYGDSGLGESFLTHPASRAFAMIASREASRHGPRPLRKIASQPIPILRTLR